MKALIQRVKQASVTINNELYSQINKGLLIFLGVEKDDTFEQADWLVAKILKLRIFEDENYKPNHLKLIFDFNAETDDVVFLYNMEDIQNSTSVYYYSNGPVIADMVTYQSVGVLETTTTRFPARQQT